LTTSNSSDANINFSAEKPFEPRIFNIKISTWEGWQEVQKFKADVWEKGLDVCHVTLSLIRAYNDGSSQVNNGASVQNIQMNNTFVYSPQKPRREPFSICAKKDYSVTITRAAFDYYILGKAREIPESFSYRDFLELDHALFRKSVSRLRRQRKIIALEPRSNPRYYILSERANDYPSVTENNRVKLRFTSPCLESHDGGLGNG